MRLFTPTDGPFWLKPFSDSIVAAFKQVMDAPFRLWASDAADLPPPGDYEGGLVWAKDAARIAYSDGAGWRQLQPRDATLDALAALNANGLLAQTAPDSFTARALVAPAAGVAVANGDAVAGNPTLSLANDLAAVEGLASTGLACRTAADTWAVRSIAVPAAGLTITNPAGVAGNPTLALANDLAALEALGGTNTIYYRSGVDTWSAVTIGGTLTFSAGTLSVAGAPVTRTDDANVTLALGGSASTGAVNAFSLTLGWTGQLAVGRGGTGIATYAVGDIVYASASTTLARLAAAATGNVLVSGGLATAPSWGKVGLATHVSGTLPSGNGGTGWDGSSFSTFTPTATPGAGAFTTVSSTGRHVQIGKLVFIEIWVTITNNGTGAGFVHLTGLPVAAKNNGTNFNMPLGGREQAVVGFSLNASIPAGATTMDITKVDGTYPGGTGYVLAVTGWYEAA